MTFVPAPGGKLTPLGGTDLAVRRRTSYLDALLRLRKTSVSLLAAIFASLVFAGPASAVIKYRVSIANPDQHLFHVSMSIPMQNGEHEVIVQLPAWNALYQVRDFSYRVRDVQRALPFAGNGFADRPEKLDKQTWRFKRWGPEDGTWNLNFTYTVYWDDPGPFNSQLNTHHAFINLAEILMYVPDRRAEASEVALDDVPAEWNVAVELPAAHDANTFAAPTYDALVDAPVEIGKFEESEFDSAGAHFRLVMDGTAYNRRGFEAALERITGYQIQLFGGAPFKNFTFLTHVGPNPVVGGGGMEHMNSTAIAGPTLEANVLLAAHEFFHVWNVKRIRPQALEPFDYTKEQYTHTLWFAEGCTDAYTSYTLVRTGLWSKKQFYDDLAEQIERTQVRPAHSWQSPEESSLNAWFEKYEGYNVPDRSISYYDQGQVVGEMIDLEIRDATDNHKSLDDVFRLMNEKFAKQGKFYDEEHDIRAAIEQVAGKSFEEFFHSYVSGVREIPYNQILAIAGLELKTDAGYSITEVSHANDRQRRIREGVLRGTTD
jgi:predicted metalloprotease with PDZ domain